MVPGDGLRRVKWIALALMAALTDNDSSAGAWEQERDLLLCYEIIEVRETRIS